jgi:hypothetical protein
MYAGTSALIHGLLKNATEGMARPVALPIWTALLFGGHVLPVILLGLSLASGAWEVVPIAAAATALPLAARFSQALRCREPLGAVLLHPAGMLALLAIQWTALLRSLLGVKTEWRGRAYEAQA